VDDSFGVTGAEGGVAVFVTPVPTVGGGLPGELSTPDAGCVHAPFWHTQLGAGRGPVHACSVDELELLSAGGVHAPDWHVHSGVGGVPRHAPDGALRPVFGDGVVAAAGADDVHAPFRQTHSAPGCAPGQFPAPPPATAPVVVVAVPTCQVPF
jgi:hypothetical protein